MIYVLDGSTVRRGPLATVSVLENPVRCRRPVVLAVATALALAATAGLVPTEGASAKTPAPAPVRAVRVGAVSAATVALSWTSPSKAATVVRLAKGTAAPRTRTSGVAVATVKAPGHTVTAIRLAPATTYTFALFSTTGHGRYSKASVVRAVTAPSTVSRVHVSSTENTATLAWTNPVGSSAVVVRYARGTVAPRTPTTGTAVPLASAKAATAAVRGLAPGTTYAFGIWARDAHGHYSAPADVRVTTVPLPGAVTDISGVDRAPSVVLSWTNPTAASFTGVRICRGDGPSAPEPDPATCAGAVDVGAVRTWSDPSVATSTRYTYWLFAHDAFGHYAPGQSVVVLGPPAPVTNAVASPYSATIALLTWTPSNSATFVQICRTAAGAAAPQPDACGEHSFVASKAPYADRTALPGRTYDYYLFANDGNNNYSVPDKASVTLKTPVGAAIEGTVTAADNGDGVGRVTVYLIAPDGRPVSDTDDDNLPDSDVLATTTTAADGTYAFTSGTTNTNGIPPSNVGVHVCFDAIGTDGYHPGGYASQCRSGATWDTDPDHPTGTTAPLAAGLIDTVDAVLSNGGGIQGSVTPATGQGASGAEVDVYSTSTNEETYGDVGADGHYEVTGLNPGGYVVCYSFDGATKALPAGLAPQCYLRAVVGTSTRPTTVGVTAGHVTTITDTAGAGGAVTGVVDDAADGTTALSDVDVYVFDAANDLVGFDSTGANGAYAISGLPTGQALTVCFDGEYSTTSSLGFDAECSGHVAWDVVDAPAPDPGTTTLAAGKTTFVDFTLRHGGAVTGQLTNAGNGFGVSGVDVVAFSSVDDRLGRPLVWDGVTDENGNYDVAGLPTGSYRVCFDATRTSGGSSHDPGYLSQCNGGAVWAGTAPAGSSVPVTAGTTTILSSTLVRAGGVTGVASSGSGTPLTDVTVAAVDADGVVVDSVRSDTDGSYALLGLPAGSYTLCWSGARSIDASAPSGYDSGCLGSADTWTGGAAPSDASTVAVVGSQDTVQNVSLIASGAASPHAAARVAVDADSGSSGAGSAGAAASRRPAGLGITAVQRLQARHSRVGVR